MQVRDANQGHSRHGAFYNVVCAAHLHSISGVSCSCGRLARYRSCSAPSCCSSVTPSPRSLLCQTPCRAAKSFTAFSRYIHLFIAVFTTHNKQQSARKAKHPTTAHLTQGTYLPSPCSTQAQSTRNSTQHELRAASHPHLPHTRHRRRRREGDLYRLRR